MKPYQRNQQHPQIELTELQQQMQQANLQMQLVEQMRERVHLLEQQVQQQNTQQEQQQQQHKVKGQGTSGDHLLEQVQHDEIIDQKGRQ